MRLHENDGVALAEQDQRAKAAEADQVAAQRAVESQRPEALVPSVMMQLQRTAGNAGVAALISAQRDEDSPVKDVVSSGRGLPLDAETRVDMEGRFGHDFGDVRIHTDGDADVSAQAVRAHAYTVGDDVVFAGGKYDPGSPAGKRTLAHELTHVVQQRSGPVDGTPAPGGIQVSDPSDRFEQEAERTADRVMLDPDPQPAPVTPGPSPLAQRAAASAEEEDLQTLSAERAADVQDTEAVPMLGVQREEAPEEEVQALAVQRAEAGKDEAAEEELA